MRAEINMILDRLLCELARMKQSYSLLNSRSGFLFALTELDSATISAKADKLVELYSNDIDIYFPNECLHFKGFMPSSIDLGNGITRKPNGIDVLHIITEKKLESTFPNIDVALRIFLSIAATNCTGERSFSTLKRIKNFIDRVLVNIDFPL